MKLIKPLTLEIDEEVWRKVKEIVPRTKTLNSVVVDLITDFVTGKKNKKCKQQDWVCFTCGEEFQNIKDFDNHRVTKKHTGYTI